jgi:hypothetical protein
MPQPKGGRTCPRRLCMSAGLSGTRPKLLGRAVQDLSEFGTGEAAEIPEWNHPVLHVVAALALGGWLAVWWRAAHYRSFPIFADWCRTALRAGQRLNPSHAVPTRQLKNARVTRAYVAYRRHLHFKPLGSAPPPILGSGLGWETLSGIRTDSSIGKHLVEIGLARSQARRSCPASRARPRTELVDCPKKGVFSLLYGGWRREWDSSAFAKATAGSHRVGDVIPP